MKVYNSPSGERLINLTATCLYILTSREESPVIQLEPYHTVPDLNPCVLIYNCPDVLPSLGIKVQGLPLRGEVKNLPKWQKLTYLIVSRDIMEASARDDLLCPMQWALATEVPKSHAVVTTLYRKHK
jgi:hypothetical protein